MSEIELSILIPVCNEAGNVGPLHEQLSRVLRGMGCSYEILFVDDGSTDATLEQLERIVREDSRVRVMGLRRNFGKSAALAVGFREVCGARVITMDGDLQDDPEEIPDFLAKLGEGFDMVSGWKRTRHDP
ncbi:MAG: glycosyltransferase family 2 protein, partial [Candidatus Eisenbacteria sp.]|nr:glycosyltransferase family 2 protein [Candidatus Eisenbacteria bacterium]